MSTNKPAPPCPLCGAVKDQDSLSGFVACNCGLELPRNMYVKVCREFAKLEACKKALDVLIDCSEACGVDGAYPGAYNEARKALEKATPRGLRR